MLTYTFNNSVYIFNRSIMNVNRIVKIANSLRSSSSSKLFPTFSIIMLLFFLFFVSTANLNIGYAFAYPPYIHARSTLGPECCSNPPALISGGNVQKIGSLDCYVSGNPHSEIAIILASDVWGFGAQKLRNVADKVASAGYYVVVPDFFHGDPLTPEAPKDEWLKKHAPEQAAEFAKPLIQALKKKGICKVAAAGFCWGAKGIVELAKTADIQVAALLHPSFVTLDDIKGVKVPTGILSAELDGKFPPELVKECEAALKANRIEHFVKIYPGVKHGWTIRYLDEDEPAKKLAFEAHQDLINWFDKSLKTYK